MKKLIVVGLAIFGLYSLFDRSGAADAVSEATEVPYAAEVAEGKCRLIDRKCQLAVLTAEHNL